MEEGGDAVQSDRGECCNSDFTVVCCFTPQATASLEELIKMLGGRW